MIESINNFLGRGWKFPPLFNKISNGVQMEENEDDIASSIKIILGTYPGERLMQPDFGCRLTRMNFETVSSGSMVQINEIIASALLRFEPRVKFEKVDLVEQKHEEGILVLRINYRIIITNSRHNIVFPFYMLEGTNLG